MALQMSDFVVQYIFGGVDNSLKKDIKCFWEDNISAYKLETNEHVVESKRTNSKAKVGPPLRRQPAAIARNRSGEVVGIVVVVLRQLDSELNLGTHAYFQRMYVSKNSRSARLAYRLYQDFLQGFIAAKDSRDHRARYLMAENRNPRLRNSFIRKYFTKLGFRMLGSNDIDSEIWSLQLITSYSL
ncbi:hypothetical protein PMIT1313_01097 [Prochlorococcus marinus str. MIT 1313]|nr:hypothetical protein PMIT1313_01097 [Prochlorococcus marinus str. MIT 1313]KZR72643.1 hypothetical protein PMIT1318_01159 [Prochlorococcus marinus str. MIT 1318]